MNIFCTRRDVVEPFNLSQAAAGPSRPGLAQCANYGGNRDTLLLLVGAFVATAHGTPPLHRVSAQDTGYVPPFVTPENFSGSPDAQPLQMQG